MYTHTCLRIHACMYMCIYIYAHMHMQIQIHVRMYAYIYIYLFSNLHGMLESLVFDYCCGFLDFMYVAQLLLHMQLCQLIYSMFSLSTAHIQLVYSLYTAYTQFIYSLYTASTASKQIIDDFNIQPIQFIYSVYTAYIQLVYSLYTAHI